MATKMDTLKNAAKDLENVHGLVFDTRTYASAGLTEIRLYGSLIRSIENAQSLLDLWIESLEAKQIIEERQSKK